MRYSRANRNSSNLLSFDLFEYVKYHQSYKLIDCRRSAWLDGKRECKQKLSESQHQFAKSNYPNVSVTWLTGSSEITEELNDSLLSAMKLRKQIV